MTVRVSSPTIAAFTAVALVAPCIPAIAPIAAASPYVDSAVATVSQGDTIYNAYKGQECVVGWLKDGYAFTSGQCGSNGDMFWDANYHYLGTFETKYDPDTRRNDFGWIKLDWQVGEGENEYELLEDFPVRNDIVSFNDGTREYGTSFLGFDGTTGIAGIYLRDMGAKLGQPIYTENRELVGLFSGELGGFSMITRPDQIAENLLQVDASYIAKRQGSAQHSEVWEFSPVTGAGQRVGLPSPATVDQGMKLVNGTSGGSCTIGFIADGVVYTSGHCGNEGDDVWLSKEGESAPKIERIGTFHTNYKVNESLPEDARPKIRNDYGYITIESPWVQLGDNNFSGDKVVPLEDIRPGLRVCAFGQTTRLTHGKRCGEVKGMDGADIVMSDSVDGEPGDSGGPVWAEDGSGLVGIYSGGLKDGSAASASYPYVETDNNNQVYLDFSGVLRSFALGVPYYSLFPLYRTFLGIRGEEVTSAAQRINQGDFLYDWNGNKVCRVGYVNGDRLFFASDCFEWSLYTASRRKVAQLEWSDTTRRRAKTATLVDSWWGEGENLQTADRIVPWEELTPGDQICTSGSNEQDTACTNLIGFDGPRLILADKFEGDYAIPGGPLWIPDKGFVGVYTESGDKWGQGMRIDMVYAPEAKYDYTEQVVKAWELGEPFYQKTPTMYADDELQPTSPVEFPVREFQAGEKLYNTEGEAVCEVARVEDGYLLTSSQCERDLYTRIGEFIGPLQKPSGRADQLATLNVTGVGMTTGPATAEPITPWPDLQPGDEVCAGDSCTTFAGYDGSKLVLAEALDGVLPGAGLHVEGKGLAGIYHRDGIGSRPDMIEAGWASSNAEAIRAAHRKGEQFYAHNDANFWSKENGTGESVPFPTRRIDEDTVLYDASGKPTCQVGHVDKQMLFVSSDCGSGYVYSAAGETIGYLQAAAYTGGASVATVNVTGHRMEAGSNAHDNVAAWDALQPGDSICTDNGCGTFFGLDGARILHDAPVPAQPGAALWSSEKGFVGVTTADGNGVRIDMVTTFAEPGSADAALRAYERNAPFYQMSDARFWSPDTGQGDAVPFAELKLDQHALLFDASGNPTCQVGYVEAGHLFVSSECGDGPFYTEGGQEIGSASQPYGADGASVAVVEISGKRMGVGTNEHDTIAPWDSLKPGDELCSTNGCGVYAGLNGAQIIHVVPTPSHPGAALWNPEKGLVGVFDSGATGSRIDMVTTSLEPESSAAAVRAFNRKQPFYQVSDARFWSPETGYGESVPFPVFKIDQGRTLFDASGNPTCYVGYVRDDNLFLSSECGAGPFYTKGGQEIGIAERPYDSGTRSTAAIVPVTGKRMSGGRNTHDNVIAWDELQHGDEVCTSAGCGQFVGLDGSNIVHTAPAPSLPGAALYAPGRGFVGVHDGEHDGQGVASRIDMVTDPDTPWFVDRLNRAVKRAAVYFQRATTRFWDEDGFGSEVPFEQHPAINQGDSLFDASGNPICTIGYVEGQTIFTSSDCGEVGDTLYTAAGEELGSLEVPASDTSARNRFGYFELDSEYVPAGENTVTGNRIVSWDEAKPGDTVCAFGSSSGERCGTYLGQDGSSVVLSSDLAGEDPDLGGPVWIPGKGLLAVDAGHIYGHQSGARIDMITRGDQPINFDEVARAADEGDVYYQKATANYFSVAQPNGEKVPFPEKPKPKPTPTSTPAPTSTTSAPGPTTSPPLSTKKDPAPSSRNPVPSATSAREPEPETSATTSKVTPTPATSAPVPSENEKDPVSEKTSSTETPVAPAPVTKTPAPEASTLQSTTPRTDVPWTNTPAVPSETNSTSDAPTGYEKPTGTPQPSDERPADRPSDNYSGNNSEQSDGSADGSSTGGIIAAILVPLLLLGLGFLATQVIDMTQFGLPPVPKILPI